MSNIFLTNCHFKSISAGIYNYIAKKSLAFRSLTKKMLSLSKPGIYIA
jgi:hypothetical protein